MINLMRKALKPNLLIQQKVTQKRLFSATAAPSQKDYYQILGIEKSANDAQIKQAYLSKAKLYHPDNQQFADVDKFRDVVEAYQILSVRENRLNYDLTKDDYSDLFYDANKTQKMKQKRQQRDKVGNFVYDYKRGSFVEHRKRQLRKERLLFNVDEYGRYRGGVPTKQGRLRGKSLSNIGQTHDLEFHNLQRFHHHDSTQVTRGDAQMHREAMMNDQYNLKKERPWYPLLYDREQRHWKDRHYYLQMILLIFFLMYLKQKIPLERYRLYSYNKNVNFVDGKLQSDHFVNRGGVVLQKEFLGFESTHANSKKLNDWYDMVYKTGGEPPTNDNKQAK